MPLHPKNQPKQGKIINEAGKGKVPEDESYAHLSP